MSWPIDDIRPGDVPSAQERNEDKEALRRALKLTFGPGFRVEPINGGLVVSLATQSAPTEFYARITGNVADGTNRWKYSWVEIVKSGAGYGGWTTKSGGRSGTTTTNPARNYGEDQNAASGTLGNGVAVQNIISGFAAKAAPTNLPVKMDMVRLTNGTIEYWFDHTNAIDGACP